MGKIARDVMTPDPACCTPTTSLDQVARMMVQNNCGEIPVVDVNDHPVGVVTDRDAIDLSVEQKRGTLRRTPVRRVQTAGHRVAPCISARSRPPLLRCSRRGRRLCAECPASTIRAFRESEPGARRDQPFRDLHADRRPWPRAAFP